ncbi:hypothetical protein ACFE04_016008 [Oxalis oulophora]
MEIDNNPNLIDSDSFKTLIESQSLPMPNPNDSLHSLKTLDSILAPIHHDGVLVSSYHQTLTQEEVDVVVDDSCSSEANRVINTNKTLVESDLVIDDVVEADVIANLNDSSIKSAEKVVDNNHDSCPSKTIFEEADGVLNSLDPSGVTVDCKHDSFQSEVNPIGDSPVLTSLNQETVVETVGAFNSNESLLKLSEEAGMDEEPQPISMVHPDSIKSSGTDDGGGRELYWGQHEFPSAPFDRDSDYIWDGPSRNDHPNNDYIDLECLGNNCSRNGYHHHRDSRCDPWDKFYGTYPRRDFHWESLLHRPRLREETLEDRVIIEATGVGAGLNNMGNTCFINAILQCFLHTVPLIQGLCSHDHISPCASAAEEFCVICALREQSELSFNNSGWMISPTKIVRNLKYFSSYFQAYQQEDAHEFLQCFLDKLDRCCLDINREGENLDSEDASLVQQVFGGSLLKCCNCGYSSKTNERLIDLSLEIDDVDTLPCALESFTKLEKLDDPDAKFTCEECKEKVCTEKQLLINHAPAIATFHLKRFKTDGYRVEKIGKKVEFPLELDLQPYISESQNPDVLKYWLYGVLVHKGYYPTSGHYFCYIQSSPGVWHELDDEKVERVDEEFVLNQRAYILFYAKQDTPWFSTVIEVKKPCLNTTGLSNSSPKSVLDNRESETTSNDSAENVDSSMADKLSEVPSCSKLSSDEGLKCNEVKNPAEGNYGDIKESMQGVCLTDAKKSNWKNSYCDETLCDKKSSSKLFVENHHDEKNRESVLKPASRPPTPLRPPQSSSPNAVLSSVKGGSYSIPRDHLKTQNQIPSRKPQKTDVRDSDKKEALRYVNKHSGRTRRPQLINLIMNPDGGSPNKRRRGVVNGSSNAKQKLNHSSGMPGLAVYR